MAGKDIEVTDEIRAAAIMGEIREKVRKKMDLGMDVSNMSDILVTPIAPGPVSAGQPSTVSGEIAFLNNNYSLQHNYLISSHRPILGKALVLGRQMVNGEVRRYLDPVIEQQNRLNYNSARAIGGHDASIMSLVKRIEAVEEKNARVSESIEALNDRAEENDSKVNEQLASLNNKINVLWDFVKNNGSRAYGISGGAESADPGVSMEAFTAKYGGSEDNIKELYAAFIPYYSGRQNVIDVGSGRGFFLDLAHEHGIGATGVDIDLDLVCQCTGKGMKALLSDAIAYLDKQDDDSIDGIFMAHVIEHLDNEYINRLISLFRKKSVTGSPLVIITPNIENLSVSAVSFYMDPTHRSHIHPEYLAFLLAANGFEVVATKYYQPTIPESLKLEKLDQDEKSEASVRKLNDNIEKLNRLVFGDRDFAIVARKI